MCQRAPEVLLESPTVVMYRAVLTVEECERLIEAAAPRLIASTVRATGGGDGEAHGRVSQTAVLRADEVSRQVEQITHKLAAAVPWPCRSREAMQVTRYEVGGVFKAHLDAYAPETAGGRLRQVTQIAYLNSGYEGGETAFVKARIAVRGEVGDVLALRNVRADGGIDLNSLHAGLPVRMGEKWIAVLFHLGVPAPAVLASSQPR